MYAYHATMSELDGQEGDEISTFIINGTARDPYVNIIKEIQKYPPLYNPDCKDYLNVPLKENLWLSIASRLDMEEEVCKKKWRNLRDQFIKKKRMLKTLSGREALRVANWRYMEIMDFLVPYINTRKPRRKSRQSPREAKRQKLPKEEEDSSDNREDREEEGWMASSPGSLSNVFTPAQTVSFVPGAGPSPSNDQLLTSGNKRKAIHDLENATSGDFFGQYHHGSTMRDGSFLQSHTPRDEDEYFMLSCVSTLRKLSPYRKMELKCKIQQLLLEYTPKDASQ